MIIWRSHRAESIWSTRGAHMDLLRHDEEMIPVLLHGLRLDQLQGSRVADHGFQVTNLEAKDFGQHAGLTNQGNQPTYHGTGLTETGCLADQSAIGSEQFVDSLEHPSWIVHQMKSIEGHDRIVRFRLEPRIEEIDSRESRIADLSFAAFADAFSIISGEISMP